MGFRGVGGFLKILIFHYVFHYFWVAQNLAEFKNICFSQGISRFFGLQCSPSWGRCWTSSWEAPKIDFGPILGGFWVARTAPRPKMAPKQATTEPRRPQDGPRMAPRRSKDVLRCIQDRFRFENIEIEKNFKKSKEFHCFLGGLGGFSEAKTLPRRAKLATGRARSAPGRLQEGPR